VLPGGAVFWSIVFYGAAIALVGTGGVWLTVRRVRAKRGRSLSPPAGLVAAVVLLFGLYLALAGLNLQGNLGR